MLKTIFIVLVLAPGPFGYRSFSALESPIQAMSETFKAGGFFLSTQERYIARGNARFLAPLSQRVSTFQRVKAWKQRQLKLKNKAIYIFLPPSVEADGTRWMWGMATQCRPKDGVAVGVALNENVRGDPRVYQSIITAAHEIAHILGADHNLSNTSIMNPDAIAVSTKNTLRFEQKEFDEMHDCLKAWRLGG